MIICAAIKIEHSSITGVKQLDLIIGGYRHGNCLEVVKNLDLNINRIEQGFITHTGEFLDRKRALWHAKNVVRYLKPLGGTKKIIKLRN